MKLPLLVFAAFRFLVTPVSAGGTRCGRTLPGHCRLYCGSLETSVFLCDQYRRCCVKNDVMAEPILPPSAHKPKRPCRKNTESPNRKPGVSTPSKPLSSTKIQRTVTTRKN